MYKPPYAYTGNKYKQLPVILEHLPTGCDTMVDVFGGSGVVALNCAPLFAHVTYNEISPQVRMLFFHATSTPQFAEIVERVDNKYSSDSVGYYALRVHYNTMSESAEKYAVLYCLVCRSFNNQLRFNRKGEFNLPYGSRNLLDLNRIKQALEVASRTSIGVSSCDFRLVFKYNEGRKDTVLFVDPPYYRTSATYNTSWSEQDEHDLYAGLDALHANGVKWMLTNTLHNRGVMNEIFAKWLDTNSYLDVQLNGEYSNSSRFKSSSKSVELLVKNY